MRLSAIAADITRQARRLVLAVEDSLDAELLASWLVSTWDAPPGALVDADSGEKVGLHVVKALERARDERSLAVLRALGAVGGETVAAAARDAADYLAAAGIAEPRWASALGSARPLRAMRMRDVVFDDVTNVIIEFSRADSDRYCIGVLVDNNLHGLAKDLILGPSLPEIREAARQSSDDALRFEHMELEEAARRCREALRRTAHTVDAPVSEHYDWEVAVAGAHLGTLPDDGSPYEAREIAPAERKAALEGFLASPEGEPFRGSDDAADLVLLAIDFCADLDGDDRPLRWSPVVVELFMTWFLPREVVREPAFFERTVPEVLAAWVRYAGRVRDLGGGDQEAAETVGALRDQMLERVNDESTWGPAKAFATAAQAAGVDLRDEAALNAFVDAYNSRLEASAVEPSDLDRNSAFFD